VEGPKGKLRLNPKAKKRLPLTLKKIRRWGFWEKWSVRCSKTPLSPDPEEKRFLTTKVQRGSIRNAFTSGEKKQIARNPIKRKDAEQTPQAEIQWKG